MRMRRVWWSCCCVLVVSCAPGVEGPHLLFNTDPVSLDNPFPDARLVRDGHLTLRPNWYAPFLAPRARSAKARVLYDAATTAMERDVTGFGNFSGVLLRGSAPLDPASLPGHVARVQRTEVGYAVLERTVTVEHSSASLVEAGLTSQPDLPEFFLARPAVPLLENTQGALVVLAGITTADGQLLERGRDFAAGANTADLAAVAKALGVAAKDVLLVLPQQGLVVNEPMASLAAWADAHPGVVTIPARGFVTTGGRRPVGAWTSSGPDWSVFDPWLAHQPFDVPAVHPGRIILGSFTAFDLRDTAGHFTASAVEDPSTGRAVPLEFVLVLPKGEKPVGGWKVVMAQHGFGGRNTPLEGADDTFCLEWAEVLTAQGLGCIGIDAPSHGTRGSFIEFFSIDDLAALRDRLRQMTFDLLEEERVLATIDVDGDGVGDLDPTPRYFSNSLGSIMGAGFLPFSKHVTSAALNVPGGGLGNIIMSPEIHDLLGLLFSTKTGIAYGTPEYASAFPLLRVVSQVVVDVADPINTAGSTPTTRAVLLQMGLRDQTIPNAATEDLANAIGATSGELAVSGTEPLRVISRIDPAKYLSAEQAATYNGHNVMYDLEAARAQVLQFLVSDGRELTAP